MPGLAYLRDRTTPTGGGADRSAMRDHRNDSVSSLQRALRTLSPQSRSSPVPQTPRPKGGLGGQRGNKKQSIKSISTERLGEDRTEVTSKQQYSSSQSVSSTTTNGRPKKRDTEQNVRVAIRMRPLAPSGDPYAGRAWRGSSERNAIAEIQGSRKRQGAEYSYDKVFGEDTNTCEIYNEMVSDMVESATKEGINGTVFTYGQTSSGKTFTMQGCAGSDNSIGVIQLAAKEIFQSIKEERSDNSNTETSVRVSYVEIYNEELKDLLTDNNRRSSSSLIIREDKKGSITVEGLKEVAVNSLEQLMQVFRVGEANKSVGSTKMNDRSSRSHAILKIILEKKTVLESDDPADDKENSPGPNNESDLVVKTTSALNLVDLAGSESVRHTGASGMQKKEGGMINQSLLTLSKVLMSLGQKNPGHINYRDSKLTRMLKPSLSGNARMAVICCISPSDKYIEETRSTLQFATRAKLVKTNAVANEEVGNDDLFAKLRLESAKAKMDIRNLEEQLREVKDNNSNSTSTKRELDNLKKFLFSDQTPAASHAKNRGTLLPMVSECYTDEHIDEMIGREFSIPRPNPIKEHTTSIDDLELRPSNERVKDMEFSGDILRAALDSKAKQVKELEAKLKKSKAKDTRYSLISERWSPENDRRISMINELRSPDLDIGNSPMSGMQIPEDDRRVSMINDLRSPEPQCHSNMDNLGDESLISKLENANKLISDMQRQVDDLTLQKNDALDWIEELFAKSDQKDDKIKHVCEARDAAVRNCEELNNELVKGRDMIEQAHAARAEAIKKCDDLDAELLKVSLEVEEANLQMGSMETENDSLKRALGDRGGSGDRIEEVHHLKELLKTVTKDKELLASKNVELKLDVDEACVKMSSMEAELDSLKSAPSNQNESADKVEALYLELASVKEKYEIAKDDLCQVKTENRQLVQAQRDSDIKLRELEADLKKLPPSNNDAGFRGGLEQLNDYLRIQVRELEAFNNVYLEEKKSLVDQIEKYEEDLSHADALLKAKTSELDNVMFSLEGEEKKESNTGVEYATDEMDKLKEENEKLRDGLRQAEQLLDEQDDHTSNDEIRQLQEEKEALEAERIRQQKNIKQVEVTSARQENTRLKEDNDKLLADHGRLQADYDESQLKVDTLWKELIQLQQQLDDSETNKLKVDELREETERLRAEKIRLTNDFNDRCRRMDELSNDLADARRQVDDAKKDTTASNGLKEENEKLINKQYDLTRDLEECQKKLDNLSGELNHSLRQLSIAKQFEIEVCVLREEKVKLTADFDELKESLTELEGIQHQLEKCKNEKSELLNHLNSANEKVQESKEMVQHVAEALSEENADLKDKIESLERAQECLESRSHELQCLLSTAASERDVAQNERDNLMESNTELQTKIKHISSEKEDDKKKLLKFAADFEAQYETVRSKTDALLAEKDALQDKLTFLEASKASLQENADRILQRNNTLMGQHGRFKVEFKKQTLMIAELQEELNQVVKRLTRLKAENSRLSRDNCALSDVVQVSRARLEEEFNRNKRRRGAFGFRAHR